MSGVQFLHGHAAALSAAVALASGFAFAGESTTPPAQATRAPLVDLTIQPPETPGPWKMIITNNDRVPVRITADARRMTLRIRGPNEAKYSTCQLPEAMQGPEEKRRLVLDPGQRYVEPFDPRLYCWGTDSEKLVAGASVTAFLGWPLNERLERRKKPQEPPFAAEPVLAPAAFASKKQLASLTIWLPETDVVQANPAVPDSPPRFVGAPDLRLSTHRWADVTTHREARLSATVTNVGDRPALVHLRPDDLEIKIRKPDGTTAVCGPGSAHRAAVRDFFQTIKPGKSASVRFLLAELCPGDALERPGLYALTTTLRVREDGSKFGLEAVTGDFPAPRATLLRVRTAKEPFHHRPPSAAKPADGP